MTAEDIKNIQESWAYIIKKGGNTLMTFYDKLFEMAPESKVFFSGDMAKQSEKLAYTISFVVTNITRFDEIKESVEDLGRIHNKLNIDAKYYPMVRDALIDTIKKAMGTDYKEEIGQAWYGALNVISDVMINAPEKRENKLKSLLKKIFN